MSEPGNIPRRRSFTKGRSSRGRSRDDADDRSTGDKSTRSTGTAAARRRRSRSPLRSVAKSSRSIVGRLSKIGGMSGKSKKEKTFEAAAAALGYDDDDEVASKPSTGSGSNPAEAEPDVAGGKKLPTPKPAPVPEEDEETVYGVVIENQPSKSEDDKKAESPKKAVEAPEATKEEVSKAVTPVAPAPEPAPAPALAPEPTPAPPVMEEPPKSPTKKESKKEAKKAAKEAKKEAAKKEKEAAAAAKKEKEAAAAAAKKEKEDAAAAAAKSAPQTKDVPAKEEVKAPAPAAAPVPAPTIAPGSAIQIILLLMDPASRRFELLQLEFDSTRALVSDVLAQIPLSATVESMRTQKYRAVCDRKGAEMDNAAKLVGFTDGKEGEVILAIPQEMSARECAKLARPILSDPNVVAMLNPASAAALAPVKEEKKKDAAPAESEGKSRSAPAVEEAAPSEKSSGGGLSVLKFLVTVAAIAAGTYMMNDAITKPMGPGDRLRPGSYVSKCGFMGFVPPVVLTTLSDLAEEHVPDHAGLIPEVCEPAGIEMGKDGVLRKYSYASGVAGGEITWEIAGSVCPEGDEACVPGLVVEEDGRLTIGGQVVKIPTIKEEVEPWPFVIDPTKAGSKWW